jgi:4-amino-4-deoxy-L-arabinose transferase-like glycosyltransferase
MINIACVRSERAILFGLFAISLIILGFQVSNSGLAHPNELLYAESARDMYERGDWLTPYFDGKPRLNKPILYYWFILAAYHVLGPSLLAARLCSVLCGAIGVVLLYLTGRTLFDRATGLFAAAIALTTWGYALYARYAMTDMALTMWITAAMYGFIQIQIRCQARPEAVPQRRWVMAFYVILGLGFSTKGPPALFPLLIAAVYLLWTRQGRLARRLFLSWGWLIFLLIATPWYILMFILHPDILLAVTHMEVVARSTGQLSDAEPVWYYVPLMFGYFFPWSILFPAAIVSYRWWRLDAAPHAGRLVLCWFGILFVLFSLIRGKNPQYILPTLMPLAIIIGHAFAHGLSRQAEAPRSMRWSAYLLAALMALATCFAAVFISLLMRQLHSPLMYGHVIILAAGTLALVWSLRRRHHRAVFAALAIPQLLIWLFFLGQSLPQFDYDPGASFASAIQRYSTATDRVGSMQIELKALLFLLQRPVTRIGDIEQARDFLQPPGRAFVVMRQADWPHLSEIAQQPLYILETHKRFRELDAYDLMPPWREGYDLTEQLVLVSNTSDNRS